PPPTGQPGLLKRPKFPRSSAARITSARQATTPCAPTGSGAASAAPPAPPSAAKQPATRANAMASPAAMQGSAATRLVPPRAARLSVYMVAVAGAPRRRQQPTIPIIIIQLYLRALMTGIVVLSRLSLTLVLRK